MQIEFLASNGVQEVYIFCAWHAAQGGASATGCSNGSLHTPPREAQCDQLGVLYLKLLFDTAFKVRPFSVHRREEALAVQAAVRHGLRLAR